MCHPIPHFAHILSGRPQTSRARGHLAVQRSRATAEASPPVSGSCRLTALDHGITMYRVVAPAARALGSGELDSRA